MKKIYHIILSVILLSLHNIATSQVIENSDMVFKIISCDIGNLPEERGVKVIPFEFTNKGTRPIIINSVSVSCGCTTVSYPREPIMPGAKSKIEITYDPVGRPGFFDKKILVLTDSRRKQNVLTITGNVIERPKSIGDKYPYNIGGGLIASSSSIEFGQIPIGYSHTLSMDLYNNSTKEINITTPRPPVDNDFSYYLSTNTLKPKESGQLILTFNLKQSIIYKIYKEIIPISVDGKTYNTGNIKIKATSIPDITKQPTSASKIPAIYLPDAYHNYLNVLPTENPIKKFEIANEGTGTLSIIQIIVSDPDMISYVISSKDIAPQTNGTLTVQFHPKGKPGRYNGEIILITNDPAFPVMEIGVAANIKPAVTTN